MGYVTHEGPSREEMDNVSFTVTLVGEGWNEKLTEPTDQHTEAPNKKKIVKVCYKFYCTKFFILLWNSRNKFNKI